MSSWFSPCGECSAPGQPFGSPGQHSLPRPPVALHMFAATPAPKRRDGLSFPLLASSVSSLFS
jgi:hypothetical protein